MGEKNPFNNVSSALIGNGRWIIKDCVKACFGSSTRSIALSIMALLSSTETTFADGEIPKVVLDLAKQMGFNGEPALWSPAAPQVDTYFLLEPMSPSFADRVEKNHRTGKETYAGTVVYCHYKLGFFSTSEEVVFVAPTSERDVLATIALVLDGQGPTQTLYIPIGAAMGRDPIGSFHSGNVVSKETMAIDNSGVEFESQEKATEESINQCNSTRFREIVVLDTPKAGIFYGGFENRQSVASRAQFIVFPN